MWIIISDDNGETKYGGSTKLGSSSSYLEAEGKALIIVI